MLEMSLCEDEAKNPERDAGSRGSAPDDPCTFRVTVHFLAVLYSRIPLASPWDFIFSSCHGALAKKRATRRYFPDPAKIAPSLVS